MNTRPFDLNLVPFCPKFSGDSWVEFQEKTILEEFFRYFVKTKAIPEFVKFRPNFCNFILGPYCAEKNSHKHFLMFLHPGKEERP